jgi:hypothetical protein
MPPPDEPFPPLVPDLRAADRRGGVRYPCLQEVPYRLGDACGTAVVRDLSTTGAGLFLSHEVLPGMMVCVELLDQPRQCWRLKLLQVVHATPSSGDTWLVGSLFTKQLTEEELQGLISPEASHVP